MPTRSSRSATPARAETGRSARRRVHGARLDEGMLGNLVGYALRRAQLRAFDDFFASLADEGITPARFAALALIDANPGISQTRLARALDIARSGVVALIDTLEARGLVGREATENDRRAYALRLTPRGRARLARMQKLVEAHEARLCAGLSRRERELLLELLARLGRRRRAG